MHVGKQLSRSFSVLALGILVSLPSPTFAVNTHSLLFEEQNQQYLYIPDNRSTNLDISGDFTLEAWAKVESFSDGTVISKDDQDSGAGASYLFNVRDTGQLLVQYVDANGYTQVQTNAPAVTLNTWHHVAATCIVATNNCTIYVDGVAIPATTLYGGATGVQDVTSPFFIGANFVNGHSEKEFDGIIDEARVWTVARSAAELSATANTELAGNESGLIGYWNLNNTLTDLAQGNVATNVGGATYTTDVPFAAPGNYAVEFEASSNQYLTVPDAVQGALEGVDLEGNFTIEAWINVESFSDGTIVSKDDQYGYGATYLFNVRDTGKLFVQYANGQILYPGNYTQVVTDEPAVTLNTWHHVAVSCVVATQDCHIYVDGTEKPSAVIYDDADSIQDVPSPFLIGANFINGHSEKEFDGYIDEVRVWEGVRTQSELQTNAHQEITGTEPGLVGYWKLNNTLSDETAYANTMLQHNSPIFSTNVPFVTNTAPTLDLIGNKTVDEGQTLSFVVTATDLDGDTLTYSASNLPSGASFDANTRTFTWTPTYGDAGNYNDIEFTVTDDGSPIELDLELITISVGNINRAPIVTAEETHEVLEGNTLSFTVSKSDPDGDSTVFNVPTLPSGASFSTATGQFSWTPTLAQSGIYIITFTSTDNGSPAETGSIDVSITVGDNPTPVEQSTVINAAVVSYDLPQNIENAYLANLKKLEKFIEDGQIQPAINQLNAFINKLVADYQNNVITEVQYNYLHSLATALLADLN